MSAKFIIDTNNVFLLKHKISILQKDLETYLGDSVNFFKKAIVVTKNI